MAGGARALSWRAQMRAALAGALVALTALAAAVPAASQTLLRDAELERGLRELAQPVIAASGMPANQIRIWMIQDDAPNAVVADSQTILLTTGLMLRMDRPEMLQAVLAHEVAHLANGHIARRAANMTNARNAALIGMVAALAVARESPSAAAGIAAGTSSAALRRFLGHTRAEEAAADLAAVRYLARAGIDPTAMVDVLEVFRGQEALSARSQDPYVRTHPLTRDRLRAAKGAAAAYPASGAAETGSAYWFARAQAKLSAYLRNPSWTLRRIAKADTSDPALVARAVAHSQNANGQAALAAADALVAKRPSDPYAHELRGWVLFEARSYDAAAQAYARAAQIAPREPLIQAGYGRALLATGAQDAKALEVLSAARTRDGANPSLLRDLAQAQARLGQTGAASLTTAERYALAGRLDDAEIHAQRATDLLPRGSAGWRRADDILAAAKQQN